MARLHGAPVGQDCPHRPADASRESSEWLTRAVWSHFFHLL